MSMRARFRFLLAALLFLLFRPLAATGQTTPCKPNELQAALSSAAPVYPAAVALSNDLQKSGIAVRCILASKMDNFFEGLQGAALYRTEQGDFEALFLPPRKNFFFVDHKRKAIRSAICVPLHRHTSGGHSH
jgi:hypothetical protein